MNAINLALIPGAAVPQQAMSGTAQPMLPDGMQFALWLGQYSAANAGPGAQSGATQPPLTGELPAAMKSLLQQLAGQAATPAASGTEAKPELKPGAVLQALLEAVLDSLREILDAGGQAQATVQLGQGQRPPAGEAATDSAAKAASAASQPSSTKEAAVMWLQSELSLDKQAAVMWLQGEPASTKQGAVMWLQGSPPPEKQATELLPPIVLQQPSTDSQPGAALPQGAPGPDVSQMLLELWPKLAAQLQALLLSRYSLTAQVGQLTPQPLALPQAPMPWAAQAVAHDCGTQLPADLLLGLNSGDELLSAQAAGSTPAQHSAGLAPALPAGMSVAPASIRWFALGGLDRQQWQSGASAGPAGSVAEALVPVITGDVALPGGATVKVVIMADSQPHAAGVTPTAADRVQPAVQGSVYSVNLISPTQELPLLTATLVVQRIAELGNQLPLQQPAWAGQPPTPQILEASQALWQPATALPPSAVNLPTGQPAVAQPTLAVQPPPVVQAAVVVQPTAVAHPVEAITVQPQPTPALVVAMELLSADNVVGASQTVAAETLETPVRSNSRDRMRDAAIPVRPVVAPVAKPAASSVSSTAVEFEAGLLQPVTPVVAPEQLRQAAQIHAAIKAGATQSLAQEQSLAQVEQTHPPSPAPLPAAIHPQAGVFNLRPSGNSVGKAPSWDAAPSIDAPAPGMAFNALPAQLMQFSGREFELKPYSGLQFSELTARLLEQATTARSQGDGTYQATLDLNPPSLGRISVNISVRGDSVALQLAVASTAPREQLKGNLAALQRSLEEAGLHVVELKVVTVDPDGRPARQYREQQDQPQPTEAADDDALRLAFRQELSMSNV